MVTCALCADHVSVAGTVSFETHRDSYVVCLPCAQEVGLVPSQPRDEPDHLPLRRRRFSRRRS